MAGEHESRFNIKRIEYALKTRVLPFLRRDKAPGHIVKTAAPSPSPSSMLGWTDDTITGQFTLTGQANLTTSPGAITFTTETGACVTRYADGSMLFAPSLSSPLARREQLRRDQASLPWWEKDREAIENAYIYEAGSVVGEPVYGESAKKGTPFKHFKLRVPLSETEARAFDVYAYGQAIGIVNRRTIHAGDLVRLRASVQFHEQRLSHGRSLVVPWLNLFDVQRLSQL